MWRYLLFALLASDRRSVLHINGVYCCLEAIWILSEQLWGGVDLCLFSCPAHGSAANGRQQLFFCSFDGEVLWTRASLFSSFILVLYLPLLQSFNFNPKEQRTPLYFSMEFPLLVSRQTN
jgi:hypothetical protein